MDTSRIGLRRVLIRVARSSAGHPFDLENSAALDRQRSAASPAIPGRLTPPPRSKLGEAII